MKYSLKINKSKYLLMVYMVAINFYIQISIQAQNSMGISILPIMERDVTILKNLDTLLLQGLEIELNHNNYYWIKNSSQFQNDSESSKSILLVNKKLIGISDNLNKTLGELRKLMSNVNLMRNPEFRNILGEILDNIENVMK
ncbi:MAG: hypothetical protein KDC52_19670, partial [Ignavibacteriae bacterium]|nr:hypothetical protein [Ignavibacteriota bacterium]